MSEIKNLEDFIENNFRKLDAELVKFEELMEEIDIETGPPAKEWYKKEAIANRLYDFYMGVERIFKRIAQKLDQKLPQGANWHKDLLQQMNQEKESRDPVISQKLRRDLLELLAFRHVWVNAYGIELTWKKMKYLVRKFEDVHDRTKKEIHTFISKIK